MWKSVFRFPVSVVVFCIIGSAILMLDLARAQREVTAPSSTAEGSLKRFLKTYVKEHHYDDDITTRYIHAFIDLNGDKKNEATRRASC